MTDIKSVLALDLGEKRIGVAIASYAAKLPAPLVTLPNDSTLVPKLEGIIKEHNIDMLVIGLPRNLDGENTRQTEVIKTMAGKLKSDLKLPVALQDEALSSVRAREDIERKRGQVYDKAEVDKLAACYILEDYLADS